MWIDVPGLHIFDALWNYASNSFRASSESWCEAEGEESYVRKLDIVGSHFWAANSSLDVKLPHENNDFSGS